MSDSSKNTKPFYTTKEVADFIGVTAPTIIKWIEQGRVPAMNTAGGHRRVSREAMVLLARECGLSLDSDPALGFTGHLQRVLVFDLELDFAEMVEEFLNLQEGLTAKSVGDAIEAGYVLGHFQPDVFFCTDEIGGTAWASIQRCASRQNTRVLLVTNRQKRQYEAASSGFHLDDIVEKPVKLDAILRMIRPT